MWEPQESFFFQTQACPIGNDGTLGYKINTVASWCVWCESKTIF